jgi:hypothetical protein
MKIEIDTTAKKITFLEVSTMAEVENLKKFLGEDWEKWSIVNKEVEFVPINQWYPIGIPAYPLPYSPFYYGTTCNIDKDNYILE